MHPFVHIHGHAYYWYDLINAFVIMPVSAIYLYIAFRSIGIKTSQILIYFFFGYFVVYFGGWIVPLYYRMVILHQTQWIYSWDKPPGRFFHSVVIAHLLYTLAVCKLWKWPVRKVLDFWVIVVLLSCGIGRVGCWTLGCCYGKPSNLPWPLAVRTNMMPVELTRYPTQVIMFIAEMALAAFLWRFGKRKKYDGEVFWMGLLLFSIYRFLIEFLRTNMVAYYGLTHAQLFSIPLFILSLSVLLTHNGRLTHRLQ